MELIPPHHKMDESEIRSFFARYGSVKEVKIITDRTGVSKGYGFVSFYNDVDVQKIVEFQSVWSNPNAETYVQPSTMMNPITQYVQAYPPYPTSPVQVITGYQLPVYNYQMPPQWSTGEQRSYVIPPKSVDRSIQTVVSCLFNPENRLRNSVVTQDDYFKV
ncbi:Deleted in azoospermia-like protein [Myotis davidii]|uniref:Deleted in azoospermia-like protein n=1 Tax=Myotis davidii TaxID=225400 RepID=L5LG43_MYODS|nr:Deleted in azoospermia-like protein [Myotis davidii]